MKQLTGKVQPGRYRDEVDMPSHHPCRPIDVGMPQESTGFVYILASTHPKHIGKTTYIGETPDLKKRFKKHLDGTATEQTADPRMRPWVLLAYVSGFEKCSQSGRNHFETLWKGERDREKARRGRALTADEVADVGRMLVDMQMYKKSIDLHDKNLRFHRCGIVGSHPTVPQDLP